MKPMLLLLLFIETCFPPTLPAPEADSRSAQPPTDTLLCQRFAPPAGFGRPAADSGSFAFYLRHLPLKPPGSRVLLFDGREKPRSDVYEAVVDLPIGNKDLHQCADAVIRLRAEYLWRTGQFNDIHFNLTNGFRVDYTRWRMGGRVKVIGNKTSWEQKKAVSDTYATFWQYLEFVFTYAGTLSLSKELQPVEVSEMKIGDVFIQGGTPGHAVIVVDLAVDNTGKKVFLLAQSYMPAQEIQVLKNPANGTLSPWYSVNFGETPETPEWTFNKGDLKRFREE
ncbi:MAG: DUF4846 domain-containing protein [Lewinellaceae bacterium]|nr:DUF4846 domain-containing protein [Lewinellaceae bacterium]